MRRPTSPHRHTHISLLSWWGIERKYAGPVYTGFPSDLILVFSISPFALTTTTITLGNQARQLQVLARRRKTARPVLQIGIIPTELAPHRVMRVDVSVADGFEHVIVVVAPEVLLLDDDVHEVLLGEGRGLATAVAVEYTEEGVLELPVVGRLLVGHTEHVLHVLAAALITVARHP